ncbi:MAG TPA: AAA-associated domain-containing protein [Candidatus Angelobacter sp.]|jgi:NitT/TauT family transport system ATP-binding protein
MTTSPNTQFHTLASQGRWPEAIDQLSHLPLASAIELVGGLPDEQQQALFRALPIPLAAGILSQLPYYDQYILLHTRPAIEMRRILEEMDPNERMRLFDELPEEAWTRLETEIGEFKPIVPALKQPAGERRVVSEKPAVVVLPERGRPAAEPTEAPIIQAQAVEKSFLQPDGKRIQIVAPLDLSIYPDTIIALLGASGCGKSTLLRMLSGLAQPSTGKVLWRGKPLSETAPNVAIVFQSFALFPWLTVLENVEAPLLARGVPADQRNDRALAAIETVGLKGFESAYPKELSGGMRQRVGFARALVIEPEVLFMDEPFSALDVLTAESLRGELLELWQAEKIDTKTIFIVTHNIEEAVLLADRVIVLGRYPARIRADFRLVLPRPRDHKAPQFLLYVDFIYKVMTEPDADCTPPTLREPQQKGYPLLPHAMPGGIAGLVELLADSGGEEDLYHLAERLRMEADDLLPITDAATMLDFAHLQGGDAKLTPQGKAFAEADIATRKQLFRHAALEHILLFQQIDKTLAAKSDHSIPIELFRDILDEYFPKNDVERQLEIALDWGRYCELFTYDPESERLVQIPNEDEVESEPADACS